jgi:hypothetical protein
MPAKSTHTLTFGELRLTNLRLEVGCKQCGLIVTLDPHELPFGDHQELPKAGKRLMCGRCGAKAGYVKPQAAAVH